MYDILVRIAYPIELGLYAICIYHVHGITYDI